MAPLSTSVPFELLDRYGQSSSGCPFSPSGLVSDRSFCETLYREALAELAGAPDDDLAIYVHVPFCHVRCLYCACDTTITHSEEKVDGYLDALEREFEQVSGLIGRGRRVVQLHVGGGTPNHLNEPQLARLMEIVERYFNLAPDACTSIECNPRRTSAGQLDLIHGLGFKRISFGVQDLNTEVQRAIGRLQSLGMVRDVYHTARDTGFENVSFDLIYGLPFQTAEGFRTTLAQVVELAPDRISCFSYNHDPAHRPHQHAIDAAMLPSAAAKLALFRQAVEVFTKAGYRWIGLDLFVREGDELAVAQHAGQLHRTAIGYTPLPAAQVLAFGPSGVGELGQVLVQNEPDLRAWLGRVAAGQLPVAAGRRLGERERRRRDALVSLMCNMRLSAASATALEEGQDRLLRDGGQGLVEVGEDGIRVTPEGRYLLHGLCVERGGTSGWASTQWRSILIQ
ncbi:oxygen-independent coproporphyrinogen III oxidase [Marichromatium bheemlicum]|uniref:Coproporphyrinogen-III oxidase n=1 Tax=Marichromatium bheemlicum TaxID=365339 RepID=A0ABX1I6Q4_9GAMM|nr:oxygen-independent coproporphyrinogen III oxidase [Marichromatium bheemlicum]NKN32426.1 oxygen-independent coproporphyrinogen III oxidase [Marichromatium bheemlicum]